MSKRTADTQMTKEGDGGQSTLDFSMAEQIGGPQRATAAQLANRRMLRPSGGARRRAQAQAQARPPGSPSPVTQQSLPSFATSNTNNAEASQQQSGNFSFSHSTPQQGGAFTFGMPATTTNTNASTVGQPTNITQPQTSSLIFGQSTKATNDPPKPFTFGASANSSSQQANPITFGQLASNTQPQTNSLIFGQSTKATNEQPKPFTFGASANSSSQQANPITFGQTAKDTQQQAGSPMFGQSTTDKQTQGDIFSFASPPKVNQQAPKDAQNKGNIFSFGAPTRETQQANVASGNQASVSFPTTGASSSTGSTAFAFASASASFDFAPSQPQLDLLKNKTAPAGDIYTQGFSGQIFNLAADPSLKPIKPKKTPAEWGFEGKQAPQWAPMHEGPLVPTEPCLTPDQRPPENPANTTTSQDLSKQNHAPSTLAPGIQLNVSSQPEAGEASSASSRPLSAFEQLNAKNREFTRKQRAQAQAAQLARANSATTATETQPQASSNIGQPEPQRQQPSQRPATSTPAPTPSTPLQTPSNPKPTPSTTRRTSSTPEPTASTPKPAPTTPKPAPTTPKPTTSTPKPAPVLTFADAFQETSQLVGGFSIMPRARNQQQREQNPTSQTKAPSTPVPAVAQPQATGNMSGQPHEQRQPTQGQVPSISKPAEVQPKATGNTFGQPQQQRQPTQGQAPSTPKPAEVQPQATGNMFGQPQQQRQPAQGQAPSTPKPAEVQPQATGNTFGQPQQQRQPTQGQAPSTPKPAEVQPQATGNISGQPTHGQDPSTTKPAEAQSQVSSDMSGLSNPQQPSQTQVHSTRKPASERSQPTSSVFAQLQQTGTLASGEGQIPAEDNIFGHLKDHKGPTRLRLLPPKKRNGPIPLPKHDAEKEQMKHPACSTLGKPQKSKAPPSNIFRQQPEPAQSTINPVEQQQTQQHATSSLFGEQQELKQPTSVTFGQQQESQQLTNDSFGQQQDLTKATGSDFAGHQEAQQLTTNAFGQREASQPEATQQATSNLSGQRHEPQQPTGNTMFRRSPELLEENQPASNDSGQPAKSNSSAQKEKRKRSADEVFLALDFGFDFGALGISDEDSDLFVEEKEAEPKDSNMLEEQKQQPVSNVFDQQQQPASGNMSSQTNMFAHQQQQQQPANNNMFSQTNLFAHQQQQQPEPANNNMFSQTNLFAHQQQQQQPANNNMFSQTNMFAQQHANDSMLSLSHDQQDTDMFAQQHANDSTLSSSHDQQDTDMSDQPLQPANNMSNQGQQLENFNNFVQQHQQPANNMFNQVQQLEKFNLFAQPLQPADMSNQGQQLENFNNFVQQHQQPANNMFNQAQQQENSHMFAQQQQPADMSNQAQQQSSGNVFVQQAQPNGNMYEPLQFQPTSNLFSLPAQQNASNVFGQFQSQEPSTILGKLAQQANDNIFRQIHSQQTGNVFDQQQSQPNGNIMGQLQFQPTNDLFNQQAQESNGNMFGQVQQATTSHTAVQQQLQPESNTLSQNSEQPPPTEFPLSRIESNPSFATLDKSMDHMNAGKPLAGLGWVNGENGNGNAEGPTAAEDEPTQDNATQNDATQNDTTQNLIKPSLVQNNTAEESNTMRQTGNQLVKSSEPANLFPTINVQFTSQPSPSSTFPALPSVTKSIFSPSDVTAASSYQGGDITPSPSTMTFTSGLSQPSQPSAHTDIEEFGKQPATPADFTDEEKRHFTTAWRLRYIEVGLGKRLRNKQSAVDMKGAIEYFDIKKRIILAADGGNMPSIAGSKRKAAIEEPDSQLDQSEEPLQKRSKSMHLPNSTDPAQLAPVKEAQLEQVEGTHDRRPVGDKLPTKEADNGKSAEKRKAGEELERLDPVNGKKARFEEPLQTSKRKTSEEFPREASEITKKRRIDDQSETSNLFKDIVGKKNDADKIQSTALANGMATPKAPLIEDRPHVRKPIPEQFPDIFDTPISHRRPARQEYLMSGALQSPDEELTYPGGSVDSVTAVPDSGAVASLQRAPSASKPSVLEMPTFNVGTSSNWTTQFGETAAKSAEQLAKEEKAKRKAEEFDSDEDDEAQWEREYERGLRVKRQKIEAVKAKGKTKLVDGKFVFVSGDDAAHTKATQSTPPGYDHILGQSLVALRNEEALREKPVPPPKVKNIFGSLPDGRNVIGLRPSLQNVRSRSGSRDIVSRKPSDNASGAENSRTGDADHEGENGREGDGGETDDSQKKSQATDSEVPRKPTNSQSSHSATPQHPQITTTSTNQSSLGGLFDRVSKDKDGNLLRETPSTPNVLPPTESAAVKKSPFGSLKFDWTPKGKADSHVDSSKDTEGGKADHTWKPDNTIQFGVPGITPTVNVISPSPPKQPFTNFFGAPNSSNTIETPVQPASVLFSHTSRKAPSVGFNFGFAPANPTVTSLAPPSDEVSAATSRDTTPGITTGESANESTADAQEDAREAEPKDTQVDLTAGGPGEEGEDVVFEVKAKALVYDRPASKWDVKGVGFLRVLKNRNTGKTRVLMRQDPNGKVLLNTGLAPQFQYVSNQSKHVRLPFANESGDIEGCMLRVGQDERAKELVEVLEANKSN